MIHISKEKHHYDQKAFHEFKRLYKLINHSVLYTTSDLQGNITSVSKAFEVLSGYKESELIGKNHNLFRNPNTPNEFYKKMWNKLTTNKRFTGEVNNITKDNIEYWLRLIIEPIFDENGIKIGYASYRENVTQTKKLEYIATHDTLTDIFNREQFNVILDTQIRKANRYNHQFALIILDIDHFKKINDIYGHLFGDGVLFKLAKLLEKNIRIDDIVSRWGGEEFAILMSINKENGAQILAEKLRKIIENTNFSTKEKITISIGLGHYNQNETKSEFFERVDNALYQAKSLGRNIVVES